MPRQIEVLQSDGYKSDDVLAAFKAICSMTTGAVQATNHEAWRSHSQGSLMVNFT